MWTRRRLAILIALAAIGCFIGAVILRDNDFWLSILAGLATTLAVAIPLFYVERVFEQVVEKQVNKATEDLGGQIDQVQSRVDERVDEVQTAVNVRVDELSERIAQQIEIQEAAILDGALGPARKIRKERSAGSVLDALKHSRDRKTIENAAVFVPLGDSGVTLRFSVGAGEGKDDCVDVFAIWEDEKRRVPRVWSDGVSEEHLLAELNTALRLSLGTTKMPKNVPWRPVLDDLSKALELAEQRQIDAGDARIRPLLERVTDEWYVTDATLEYKGEPSRTFELSDVFSARRRGSPPADAPDPPNAPLAFKAANSRFHDSEPYGSARELEASGR